MYVSVLRTFSEKVPFADNKREVGLQSYDFYKRRPVSLDKGRKMKQGASCIKQCSNINYQVAFLLAKTKTIDDEDE